MMQDQLITDIHRAVVDFLRCNRHQQEITDLQRQVQEIEDSLG